MGSNWKFRQVLQFKQLQKTKSKTIRVKSEKLLDSDYYKQYEYVFHYLILNGFIWYCILFYSRSLRCFLRSVIIFSLNIVADKYHSQQKISVEMTYYYFLV